MTAKPKPQPKPDEWSAFRKLLGKIAKVPKRELDEKEAAYRRERAQSRKLG